MAFKFRGSRGEDVELKPEDIIGMSSDDLKLKLDGVAAVKEAQVEQGNTLTAIKNTLAALEGRITQPVVKQPVVDDVNDDRTPEQKFQEYTLKETLETKMIVVRDSVRNKMNAEGELSNVYWSEFEAEINKLTENDNLMSKTKAEYWQNAYDIVVGRHVSDISSGKVKARKRMFVESGSSSTRTTDVVDTNEPSDLDKRQAEKFGIPIDKYMAQKAKMVFVK